MKLPTTPGRALLAVGILAASCAITACGSGSSGSSTTKVASASTAPAATGSGSGFNSAAFRTCLQKHGVTFPSRPANAGTGTGTTPSGPPSGSSPSGGGGFAPNPKLRAAIQACGGGNFRPGARSGAGLSHTAINNFVACVRKNGYPQMPDPNFSGTGSIFPTSVEANAKFKAASRACASVLRPSNGSSSGASAASVA